MSATMPLMQTAIEAQIDPDVAAMAAWVERGDREALQGLFERHAETALRLAVHRLGNQSDADDAVQHAFVGVMRGARSFRPEVGSVRGYLLAAVLNSCAQQRRSDGSRRAREAEARPSEPQPEDPDLRDAVRGALAQLPEHQRQPVELRFLAGLDFPEIAFALGRNERTVRGQVTRGLDSMRQICSRLGLSTTTAALVVALSVLPSAAPSAEAMARVAAVAEHGPQAAAVAGIPTTLLLGAIALTTAALASLLLVAWLGRPRNSPAPTPPPREDAAATSAQRQLDRPTLPAPQRELGEPFLAWPIADDAANAGIPIASVGAARVADDVRSVGVEWFSQPTLPQADRVTWGPVRRRVEFSGVEWTPARLLRAPRVGEEAYLICVAPAAIAGDHLIFSPESLIETNDGWKLTFEGLRISPSTYTGQMEDLRGSYAFSLGRLTRAVSRLAIEVRWRDMTTPGNVFPVTARIERGELTIAAGADANGEAAALTALAGGGSTPADPTSQWQIPLSNPPMPMGAADAPPDLGGLIDDDDGPVLRAYVAAGHHLAPNTVYVLGPPLAEADSMNLRSVRWRGRVATVTVAVWEHAGIAPEAPRHRPLMPIQLDRPGGSNDLAVVELEWQHYVAEGPSGTFVRQQGQPTFAGTTRMSETAASPPAPAGTMP